MLSRGYQGFPLVASQSPGDWRDIAALTLTVILALLGQATDLRFGR